MSSSGLSRATEDFVIYLINAADEGILHTVESSSIKIQRAGRGTVDASGLLIGVAKFIHWQTALPRSLGVFGHCYGNASSHASSSCFHLI